jgi:Peptidase family M1 domain/Secretion system C-terminal sorting domain
MKNFNIFLTVSLLFSCQASTAQTKETHNITFGNQLFLDNKITADIAWQDNFKNKKNELWVPDRHAHNKLVEREMAVYRQRATTLGTGIGYDVKYYRLELRINPDTSVGKYINGKVTTYFKTTEINFGIVNFDFATPLVCDSVYYHGAKLNAGNISRPTDLLAISIPTIPAIGVLDSVSVYYQGVPPVVAAFGGGTGYVNTKHNATNNYVYTLSEPYSSYTWWPCKSFIVNDKADSLDLIISTPTGFKAVGNGTLVSETTVGANVITYWKHRYPIAAYQVCTAVANYVQYPVSPTIVNIGGTNMPLYNYLFPETNTATARATLDRTALMLTTFSDKFGDYPFKNEKYGHYTFGFGGGMEHNTFSGMSSGTYDQNTDWDIIAHELGHQWFGASVTCGSWHDIWINESFATFAESICAEFAPGVSAGQTGASWRGYHKSLAINAGNQAQSVYVSDTSTMTTIFTPAVYVYERGAMVIYMLRTLLGDAKFFQALKNYQADPLLKYGNAVTADVKRHMEAVSGIDLTTFFNQWIYNKGFASYNAAKWNNTGTQIILQLPQTTRFSALSHFDMPVAVRIQGSSGDTTVIVYDNNGAISYDNDGVLSSTGSNVVQYNLSFIPTTITFDAFNQVLANGSFTKDPGLIILATNPVNFSGKKEGDNAKLWWSMDNSSDYASFEIEKNADAGTFETIGTISAKGFPNKHEFSFNDPNILTGTGYYRIKGIQKGGAFIYSRTIAISNTTGDAFYTITPNPASDYILIKGHGTREKVDIKIYDATGKLVKKSLNQTLTINNDLKIAVRDLVVGNYFVEIQSGSNGRYTKQMVIIK